MVITLFLILKTGTQNWTPYFLTDGDYEAIVLKDGINANHDAEDYKIEKSVINQKSEMKIHLASGGGFVIKVIKK